MSEIVNGINNVNNQVDAASPAQNIDKTEKTEEPKKILDVNIPDEKKEKRIAKLWRFSARVWIMSMPAAIVLILLLLTHKITITTALLLFIGVVVFTTFITFSAFQELEVFISYLKKLAQGIEIDLPHFKKGVFSSFRLADTFQSVKNRWSNQTVSDASILEHLPDPLLMIDPKKIIVFIIIQIKKVV